MGRFGTNWGYQINSNWLVVSTPLKNISQMGVLFPIYGKIKKCSKPPNSKSYCPVLK
jgi:hypothetical protein